MITEEKRDKWLDHLAKWKESGLSANKYCIENGINKNSFRYWIDRDKGKVKPKKRLVKLNLQNSLPENDSNRILLKYGYYEIKIPTAFKKEDLQNLLEVLESRKKCS